MHGLGRGTLLSAHSTWMQCIGQHCSYVLQHGICCNTPESACAGLSVHHRSALIQNLEGVTDAGDARTPRSRIHSSSPAAAEKVRELTRTMQEDGADGKRTLETVKSIGSKSFSRGLDNVSLQQKTESARRCQRRAWHPQPSAAPAASVFHPAVCPALCLLPHLLGAA